MASGRAEVESGRKQQTDKWGEVRHKQTAKREVCGQTSRKLWQSLPISGGTLMPLSCVMRLSNTHIHTQTETRQYSGFNINHRRWQVICRGATSFSRPSSLRSYLPLLTPSLWSCLCKLSEGLQNERWLSWFSLHPSIQASSPPSISPPVVPAAIVHGR